LDLIPVNQWSATKAPKRRIKTERCDYLGFGFYCTCRVKPILEPALGKAFSFVPLMFFAVTPSESTTEMRRTNCTLDAACSGPEKQRPLLRKNAG
jgi:hypothetical protein